MPPATGKLLRRTIATNIIRPMSRSRDHSPERTIFTLQIPKHTNPVRTETKPAQSVMSPTGCGHFQPVTSQRRNTETPTVRGAAPQTRGVFSAVHLGRRIHGFYPLRMQDRL